MRDYELVLVLRPDLDKSRSQDFLKKIKKWLRDVKGEIVKEIEWGKKKLAYPMNKQTEGLFIFMEIKLPKGIKNLEKKFNLEEKLLRYLFVKKD